MDISENIKYYRKQAGYTQADLAKLLKIKPPLFLLGNLVEINH